MTLAASANSVRYFTRPQAARVANTLDAQAELMIYCGYEYELATYVIINEVWAEPVNSKYYEIWIYGYDAYTGEEIYMPIDLSCIWLYNNIGNRMYSAAQYLRFRSSVATPNFYWTMPPYNPFVRYYHDPAFNRHYTYHYEIHRFGWRPPVPSHGHAPYHPYYMRTPHTPAPVPTKPYTPGVDHPTGNGSYNYTGESRGSSTRSTSFNSVGGVRSGSNRSNSGNPGVTNRTATSTNNSGTRTNGSKSGASTNNGRNVSTSGNNSGTTNNGRNVSTSGNNSGTTNNGRNVSTSNSNSRTTNNGRNVSTSNSNNRSVSTSNNNSGTTGNGRNVSTSNSNSRTTSNSRNVSTSNSNSRSVSTSNSNTSSSRNASTSSSNERKTQTTGRNVSTGRNTR